MKKVKTIKGVPKYSVGGMAQPITMPKTILHHPSVTKFKAGEMQNVLNKNFGSPTGIQMPSIDAGSMAGFAGAAAQPIANLLGIEQSAEGLAISTIGDAAMGINPFVGAGLKILGATAGGRAKIDKSAITATGDINDAVSHNSGWIGGLFGADRGRLLRRAAGMLNSKMAYEQTANAQADYANDPRNQPVTISAKDGGVIPELVHAKVSKGELYYDPYNKTLSRVPGSPDKPNTDDDVDAFLAKGGMVVTNNNKQPLINGKTQAIALAPMVDKPNKNMSKGTIEARDRIIKKVTRLNELSKTENNKTYGIVYANTGNANIGNNENQLLNWLREKTKGTILGKNLNPPVDGDTRSELEKVRDRMKEWRETGTYFEVADPQQESNQPESNQGGFGHRSLLLTTNGAGGFKPTNKFGYLGPQSTRQLLYEPGDVDYSSQFEGWDKFYTKPVVSKSTGAGKSGKAATTASQTPPVRSVKITNTDPEKMAQKQNGFENVIKRYESKQPAFIKPVERGEEEVETTDNKKKFDLSDLYRVLSVIAPFSDKVRPRINILNKPTFKPIPVDADPTNLLLDAQLGYALNNYNTSHGGFTAGQQLAAANVAASNLATQRANIHQWEKEQELKNITQNIMAYNDYSKLLAEIGNTEIDINDRNRAAANTINETKLKSKLNTLGSIAKELKQEEIDAEDRERQYTMLKPLIEEVYENSDELLPLLKGKIKKVKKTKKSTKTEKV